MRKVFLLIKSVLLITLTSSAQEANNWYFGNYAGLSFSTTPPHALLNSALIADEGTSAISDKQGNILFYTDGVTVYNKNHTIMTNGTGLLGNTSSTNSALIIPKPGDTTHFYIFTAPAAEDNLLPGYRFSEVDMTLDNGLGAITIKNILLSSSGTERLTAVKQANGIDYWVFTKEWGNNRFKVFKIDCNGVNLNPVISDVGVQHISTTDFYYAALGSMRASPDGKKLCVVIRGGPNCGAELFDFDNNTGVISNPVFLTGYDPSLLNAYGVEFSPNSQVLYISPGFLGSPGFPNHINQYDISSNNTAAINASKIQIITTFSHYGMQLGPDSKLYLLDYLQPDMSVINNPDNYGPGLDYQSGIISLAGKRSSKGLPSFVSGYFLHPNWNADFSSAFVNCSVKFSGTSTQTGSLVWNWDFGDGVTGAGQIVQHSYRQPGTYNIKLTVYIATSCGNRIDSIIITKPLSINNVFSVDFDHTGNCVTQSYLFSDSTRLTVGNITGFIWDFGDGNFSTTQNPNHNYLIPGVYQAKLVVSTNGICRADSITKTIYVDSKPSPNFSFLNGCINQPVSFTDQSTILSGIISSWNWDFNDGGLSILKNPNHAFTTSGNFGVSLLTKSEHGCTSSVTKTITIEDKPVANFNFDLSCLNAPIHFTDLSTINFGNIATWQWNFGDNSTSPNQHSIHSFLHEGDFNVQLTVSSQNGCISDIKQTTLPIRAVSANAGPDTIAIYNQPFQLHGSGGVSYQWSPAMYLNNSSIEAPVAILSDDQIFTLKVTNSQGCTGKDDVKITVVKKFDIYVPSGFTPNGDGKNDILKPYSVGIQMLEYFCIYNRWGQLVFKTDQLNFGWDGFVNGKLQGNEIFIWLIKATDINGHVIFKKGTTVLIR